LTADAGRRPPVPPVAAPGPLDLRGARRRLLLDGAGIAVSAIGFGLVFGLSARNAGYSVIDAVAMSVIVFAGAAQFTAVGYVAAGLPWAPIVLLTAFLNARHLLYSAALAPRLRAVSRPQRAAMAHLLTDEAFALAAAHFQRIGRVDAIGYWLAAFVCVFVPWNLASLAGVVLGGAIPNPSVLGLDVVFPAAMAGLAVGLVTGRREAVAAGSGAAIGLVVSLAAGTSLGIVSGGLLGPLVGMAVPLPRGEAEEDLAAVVHGPGETGGAPLHAEPPMPFGQFDVEPGLLDPAPGEASPDDPGPRP
jgi:4-azaleucine resistance transporter AzlC